MEYSLNGLLRVKQAINSILNNNEKYKFKLVYLLRKNIQLIENEIETLRENLEDNAEGFDEYEKEKVELAQKHGAEFQQVPEGGLRATNFDDIDIEALEKDIEELNKKYEDVLEEQNRIANSNLEKAEETVAEVEWYEIDTEHFNETLKPSELPKELLPLIKD